MNVLTTAWTAQATTDAYADLGDPWVVAELVQKTIVVRETGGANGANYKILGSVDGTNFVEVVAEQTLAASASGDHQINDHWMQLKIQVKASVGGSQAEITAEGSGIGV